MPKSKRPKLVNLTKVPKKSREQKDKLFERIRAAVNTHQHCLIFSLENNRNAYLQTVRRELSDCS
jgi:mRNA turnover protein 4